jgi:NAD(P)-dependent dehydrogenase (short-subunit alcohol dehydrogenase family)
MMRFEGRVAVISGGASGIGQATTVLLAREGANVAILDIEVGRREVAPQAVRLMGVDAFLIETDVLDKEAVDIAIAKVLDRFRHIDILINNLGGSSIIKRPDATIDRLAIQDWESTITYNLRGTYLCTHAIVPIMKRQRYGRIVNLSSIVARGDTRESNVAYATAKAGIRAFTRKLAIELGPFGITCNATAPGVTLTDRILRLRNERSDSEGLTMPDIPLGRMATPEDQAKVIAFLASDDAAFVSGQTIEVTGGQ